MSQTYNKHKQLTQQIKQQHQSKKHKPQQNVWVMKTNKANDKKNFQHQLFWLD